MDTQQCFGYDVRIAILLTNIITRHALNTDILQGRTVPVVCSEKTNEPTALWVTLCKVPNLRERPYELTNTVQEQLGFGREAVVDYIVEQGDVNPTGSQVSDNQDLALAMGEPTNVDLTSCLVQRAVDVRTVYALRSQQLRGDKQASRSHSQSLNGEQHKTPPLFKKESKYVSSPQGLIEAKQFGDYGIVI